MLYIDVITLFPEFFAPSIGLSILGRAQERGLVRIELHHLLDALGDGERADDRPFGGGPGMVLRIEPLARVLDAVLDAAPADERRAIVDATVRLVEGAINAESLASESFTGDTLDSPAYTRPAAFRGHTVPDVLLSGDHAKIAAWRRQQSRDRTIARRNDLLDRDAAQEGQPPEAPPPKR